MTYYIGIFPDLMPLGAVAGCLNIRVVILTPLNIQPAPEVESDILKAGAVNRVCGQVVGLRHVARVIPLEVIAVNIISAMA